MSPLFLIKKDAISILTIGRTIPSPKIDEIKLREPLNCITRGDFIKSKKIFKRAGTAKPNKKVRKPTRIWCLVIKTLKALKKIFLT